MSQDIGALSSAIMNGEVPTTSFVTIGGNRISKRFLRETEKGWLRRCRICGVDKEATPQNFIPTWRPKFMILDRICRECRIRLIGKGERTCSRCRRSLPATTEFFGVNRGRLEHTCRKCQRPSALEAVKRWRKKSPDRARFVAMLSRARLRAKKANVAFDEDAAHALLHSFPKNCKCCGAEMGEQTVRGKNRWVSLDRIRPDQGYVKGNIGIICYRCNVLKSDGTLEEFEAIVRYLGGVRHE